MADQIDRLWPLTWLGFRAGPSRSHNSFLTQIFGPPKIGPDGYPGRPMARPSAILERFWLQNDPSKWRQKVIEFWLRWNCDFCYPSHAKSTFSLSRTPPKMVQNLFKKTLCNQTPPKSWIFNLRAPLDGNMNRKGFQKGFLLGRPGAPKIQKSSSKRGPKCGREPTPQNGPSFSPNGCQNVFPKQYNLAQILSKEVSRNVLNETNSGK